MRFLLLTLAGSLLFELARRTVRPLAPVSPTLDIAPLDPHGQALVNAWRGLGAL